MPRIVNPGTTVRRTSLKRESSRPPTTLPPPDITPINAEYHATKERRLCSGVGLNMIWFVPSQKAGASVPPAASAMIGSR